MTLNHERTHSEPKQARTLEFGTEEAMAGPCKETWLRLLKSSPKLFSKAVFGRGDGGGRWRRRAGVRGGGRGG